MLLELHNGSGLVRNINVTPLHILFAHFLSHRLNAHFGAGDGVLVVR